MTVGAGCIFIVRLPWQTGMVFSKVLEVTSEENPYPMYIREWLRNYVAQGIIDNLKGIVIGKAYNEVYQNEYKKEVVQVIRDDIPIIFNMNFGHISPMCVLPLGVKAKIDCTNKTLKYLNQVSYN